MSLKDIKNLKTTTITSFDVELTNKELKDLIRVHYRLPKSAKIELQVRDTYKSLIDFDHGRIEVSVEGEGINLSGEQRVLEEYKIGDPSETVRVDYVGPDITSGHFIPRALTDEEMREAHKGNMPKDAVRLRLENELDKHVVPDNLITNIVMAATGVWNRWKKSGAKPDTDMPEQRRLYDAVNDMQEYLNPTEVKKS